MHEKETPKECEDRSRNFVGCFLRLIVGLCCKRMSAMPDSLSQLRVFDPVDLQLVLQKQYKEALIHLQASLSQHGVSEEACHIFVSFLERPGKMMRSLLLLGSYLMDKNGSENIPDGVLRVAVAQEMFHNFTLIHDDVIDASPSRRGAPSLHRRFAQLCQEQEQDGEHLAIVFGDVLFGHCVEVIAGSQDLPAEMTLSALRYFSETVQSTGCGQAMEMLHHHKNWTGVSEQDIAQVYYLKTSRYTIESPVVLGRLLAGDELSSCTWIKDFATPLGMAFQMENDLHEIRILPTENWRLAYDIFTGVKTMYSYRLFSKTSAERKEEMNKLFSQPEAMHRFSHEEVLSFFYDESLLESCEQEIAALLAQSIERIRAAELGDAQTTYILSLITCFTKKLSHSEASHA